MYINYTILNKKVKNNKRLKNHWLSSLALAWPSPLTYGAGIEGVPSSKNVINLEKLINYTTHQSTLIFLQIGFYVLVRPIYKAGLSPGARRNSMDTEGRKGDSPQTQPFRPAGRGVVGGQTTGCRDTGVG